MDTKSVVTKNESSPEPSNVLIDYVSKNKGFKENYKNYIPESVKVKEVNAKLPHAKMVVVSAYWCPDCRNNVPKMTQIANGLPNWSFEIMDRDDKGVKEKYSIKKIPTFIIYDEQDKELGRIIENPTSGSLENDLLTIVQGKE